MPIPIADQSPIVVTASRAPESGGQTPASVTVIDGVEIERLGDPLVPALIRLTPSAAVTTSGPQGSLTEVRIRGAEANHTLLFVDGIKINDPASGDIPRFELLNADLASRIEIVRGPQSALWGSDAIGGVVAVEGLAGVDRQSVSAEAGSFGSRRASAGASFVSGPASIAGGIGWQRSDGIDSFGGPGGDRDAYHNLSGRLRSTINVGAVTFGASGIALTGSSQFDGYNPSTFVHENTLDSSRNRLFAGRLWAETGGDSSPWRGRVGANLLGSSNRNFLDGDPVNRTRGSRRIIEAQVERLFRWGGFEHRFIIAAEDERESFHSRDIIYFGATDQDRKRAHQALTGEYRFNANGLTADVALRRDHFGSFKDATSLRASMLVPVAKGFALRGAYARGIAPPTFFDLYGFFPGNFVGNPELKPESSDGFEFGVRYSKGRLGATLTFYRQRLKDEIVDVFDPVTFLQTAANRGRDSHRSGIEAELNWSLGDKLRLSANYSYLHATQPGPADVRVIELRRPRHSGAIIADGSIGRWSYGVSVAYVGERHDFRDNFPYDEVRLGSYWLASARVGYAVRPSIELFVRGSNLLDARYREAAGYRTEGFGLFGGIRLAGRRSSP